MMSTSNPFPSNAVIHLPRFLDFERFAKACAEYFVHRQAVVHLCGGLGAGKTTFVRALLKGLGHVGRVKSPSYTLLERYRLGSLHILHSDFYRLSSEGSHSLCLEIEEQIEIDNTNPWLVLLEWPENQQYGTTFLSFPNIKLFFYQQRNFATSAPQVWLHSRLLRKPEQVHPLSLRVDG